MKDIWTYTVHSRRLTICYTPESIRHPAKKHPGKQHPYPLEEDILMFRK